MIDSIKAKNGYKVYNIVDDRYDYAVFDGKEFIFFAIKQSISSYRHEFVEHNNDMAQLCEVFTTVKGNKFIYWRDNELDIDYLTKVGTN